MKRVSVIGLFCEGRNVSDGQSIKTRIVTQELEKALGSEQIRRIDTFGWKKDPIKLFSRCIAAVQDSENVIFMTDAGGIRVFPWLLHLANCVRRAKLHYVVIGGWLVPFLEKHSILSFCLRHLNCIFVETCVMKSGLEKLGFSNVHLMPNCKPLVPLTREQMTFRTGEPYRFCIFSRVMREKGVEDAVRAIQNMNARYGKTVCTLDIFGQIDPGQTEWFETLSAGFPTEIRYRGVVPFDQSVEVLRDYHALLFPTRFYTEGIPGTIIDAYAAGIPVVASRWESFSDIIDHGVNGFGYTFGDDNALEQILSEILQHPEQLREMKPNCLQKAECYKPDRVMGILLEVLSIERKDH